jgi:hypothetical protein
MHHRFVTLALLAGIFRKLYQIISASQKIDPDTLAQVFVPGSQEREDFWTAAVQMADSFMDEHNVQFGEWKKEVGDLERDAKEQNAKGLPVRLDPKKCGNLKNTKLAGELATLIEPDVTRLFDLFYPVFVPPFAS